MNSLDISTWASMIFYGIATIAMTFRLFHPKGPNIVVILFFGCLGIITHSLSISQFLLNEQVVNFSLPNVVSLVSLLISLTITTLALRYKVNLLLPVAYGFTGLWQLLLLAIPAIGQSPQISSNIVVFIHITIALIAYCILVIATLYAFQVNFINNKLKSKNLSAVNHLPPLMQVEGQLFTILAMGTLSLLVSQVIGFIFLEQYIDKSNAHKTILSLLALIIYSVVLWGHYAKGWRGNKVLSLTTFATALLTLAYFGSRFVKEFLL